MSSGGRWGWRPGSPGSGSASSTLHVVLRYQDRVLADDRYRITDGEVNRAIRIPDPGIHDARSDLLWQPHDPKLVEAELTLLDPDGNAIDRVGSYCGMRSVGFADARFELNRRTRFTFDSRSTRDIGPTPA